MKKNLVLIGIILATIILAVLSVVTALKIKQLGTQPVAPSAPQSKPKATQPTPIIPEITPAVSACRETFSLAVTLTPTPSLTTTPGPTSTPTTTPNPTGTPPAGPYCQYLHATPNSGTSPLAVHFTGKGFDPTRVKGFRFTYGDGNKDERFGNYTSDYEIGIDHTYQTAGTFNAVLEILDEGDHWRTRDECTVTITVTQGTVSPTVTPRPTSTGAPVPTSTVQPTSTPRPTSIASEPSPTEVQLPQAGLKLPTITGILAGFLLISLGIALVF